MNNRNYAEKLHALGLTYLSSENKTLAKSYFRDAIDADDSNFSSMHQLAMLLAAEGEHNEACALYQKIVEIIPDNSEAWLLLAVEYAETGDYKNAIQTFRHCIAISEPKAGLHKMLGIALAETGNHDEALEEYTKANLLAPNDADILTHLAIEQIHFLKMSDAESNLLKAIEIEPQNPLAYNNLARAYKFEGRADEAEIAFRKASEMEPANCVLIDNLLLTLNYLWKLDSAKIAAEHITLSAKVYGTNTLYTGNISGFEDRIKIGYVSGDFHNHSVAYFFEPLLINHNRKKFEIFCYSNDTKIDETTIRLKSSEVHWRQIAKKSDEYAAKIIKEDGIHILIDLAGHSSGNRLGIFALKPAPIQLSWIGYPHSTGLSAIDYYVTDNFCDPVGMTEDLYSEKLLRLPKIFSCYLPPLEFPVISPPPFIKNGFITFGSFNNFAKINSELIDLWSRILKRVPSSRILLKSIALGDDSTKYRILDTFAKNGIDVERVAMMSSISSPIEHLALYGSLDIALDTYPYHGTTTTCEALWMGVPVITLAGDRHASRVGVTLLSNARLPELVANTEEEYIIKCHQLALDHKRLCYYREQLREMLATSPVMNAESVTADFEAAICKILQEKYSDVGNDLNVI